MATFDELLDFDMDNTFLDGEFSILVSYTDSLGTTTEIPVQRSTQEADSLDSSYTQLWTNAANVPDIKEGDLFVIDGIEYGVLVFEPELTGHGIEIYINEVVQ